MRLQSRGFVGGGVQRYLGRALAYQVGVRNGRDDPHDSGANVLGRLVCLCAKCVRFSSFCVFFLRMLLALSKCSGVFLTLKVSFVQRTCIGTHLHSALC